jgi:hypothetical protein
VDLEALARERANFQGCAETFPRIRSNRSHDRSVTLEELAIHVGNGPAPSAVVGWLQPQRYDLPPDRDWFVILVGRVVRPIGPR